MVQEGTARTLLEALGTVPDTGRRQGQHLSAERDPGDGDPDRLAGEEQLAGMWLWAGHHEKKLRWLLGFWVTGRVPGLGAVSEAVRRPDVAALTAAIGAWATA